MLDADLAEIYGYTTKAFNQQVKNNIEKFAEDFRFQATREEYREILGSKFLTLEQGIYKHMIVLKSLKRKSEPFCIKPGSYIVCPAIVIKPLAKKDCHIVGTLAIYLP